MRSILVLVAAAATAFGASPLAVVRPAISESDGGAPDPPNYQHPPGQTLFFTCRIANFTKSSDEKFHVAYSVQAFDPRGVPLDKIYKNEVIDEAGPQDRDWMPKVETEVVIPPLVATGDYKIVVKVEDLLAHTSAAAELPFEVRGHAFQPADKVAVQNFRFLRHEDDLQAMDRAAYKPGDGVWTQFDITGFHYGPNNKIDVSYVASVIAPSGKVLWTQPEPAAEQSESFYPKLYIPADFGISLQPNIHPGTYTIAIAVKDAIGNQTCESRQDFTIE